MNPLRVLCYRHIGYIEPRNIQILYKDGGRYPDLHFYFHAHNDYDLAVSNVFEAVRAGVKAYVTINGLGERAGNAPLSSAVAVLRSIEEKNQYR